MRRTKLVCCMTLSLAVSGAITESHPRAEASSGEAERSRFRVWADQGSDDLDDLTRQFNQLYTAGRFQDAARVGERALLAAEKAHGAEHVDDAMMLYERSLKILERGVGRDNPDHPYIAAVLENLAALYELKGWKEEAQ